jgi:iron-sulfur cluster repair protein YtfE (RIC family)
MTPFNGMKKLSRFESNGAKIPADILAKYIINDYEGSLKKQITELKQQIRESEQKRGFFGEKNKGEEIENLKALVAELESKLNKENEESRKANVTKILETHKFEETYLISLWEYGMNLVNLPTGRLSIIKKENIVLWYALTSLGRPFAFKAGVPIEVMRQIEIEKYKTINRLKKKFEDSEKTVRDFVSPETINELRENSLDYDEYYDVEETII